MYTGHYTDRIPKVPYTSVYLSVHIEYTGSLYLLIQAISCSVKQILGAQVCHQLGTSIEDFWNEYCIKHKSCS